MGTFALDMARFAEKAGANADLVVRKVAIDVLSSVVVRTPVDTGRARGNWTMAIAAPDESTTENVDKTGAATIAVQSARVAGFKTGPSIFITNSLPYIQPLEDGHSTQAPAGMVKVTVTEMGDFVRNAVASLP